ILASLEIPHVQPVTTWLSWLRMKLSCGIGLQAVPLSHGRILQILDPHRTSCQSGSGRKPEQHRYWVLKSDFVPASESKLCQYRLYLKRSNRGIRKGRTDLYAN